MFVGVWGGPKALLHSAFSISYSQESIGAVWWSRPFVGSALLDLKIGKCLVNEGWDQRDIANRLVVINCMLSLPLLQTSSLLCYLFNLTWNFPSSEQCSLQILMDMRHLNMLTSSPIIEAGACYLASQDLAVFSLSRLEVAKAFWGTVGGMIPGGCAPKSFQRAGDGGASGRAFAFPQLPPLLQACFHLSSSGREQFLPTASVPM